MSAPVLRRSSRIAAKAQTKQQPKVKTIELEEIPTKVTIKKPVPKLVDYDSDDSQRTISDIISPTRCNNKLPVKNIPEPVISNKPDVSRIIKTSNNYNENNKLQNLINSIKNYLSILEKTTDSLRKIAVTIELFEYINMNFEYIYSREFVNYIMSRSRNNSLILQELINTKSIDLQYDIKKIVTKRNEAGTLQLNDKVMCENAIKLLKKIHIKSRLYGCFQIRHSILIEDSIYKEFINTYMEDFISKC